VDPKIEDSQLSKCTTKTFATTTTLAATAISFTNNGHHQKKNSIVVGGVGEQEMQHARGVWYPESSLIAFGTIIPSQQFR
jgi:hypothetical protein